MSNVMVNFSKSVLMKKQTHLHFGRSEGEYMFRKCFYFGVNYYLNVKKC